ncbi:hypothetical protein [Virgisporangium aurantiacum]|uniref:Uncharacterized protein n=1 Tax=Virgisporangium aurantiacum TaxID=175570 RepID=A0A8J3Z3T3_9ACTN|nr:hypothetical protein [Virgisporangium aurantiacum]GIJ56192.1 hypothetical protein Vau01_037080 [Virgisporangium aurantiacum]
MNTGDHLDEAADTLARATVALRDHRPYDPDEQAAVAVGRTRLYEELRRQVGLLAGPGIDPDIPSASLASSLREATAAVRAAMPAQLPAAPPIGPVSRALVHAVDAIVTVNTGLAGHLGAGSTGPTTPEGVALRAGHGRADNLAAVARLACAAIDLDTRLIVDGWLQPAPDAGSWLPLLMAADTDIVRTEHGNLAIEALRVASRGNAAEAPSRRVNPITGDQPWRWQLITSSRLLTDALDAARSSLLTNGRDLTTTEAARMARSALICTHHIGHILGHTTAIPNQVAKRARNATTQWRIANGTASLLRSPAKQPVGGYTADNALRAVADWLSRTIGPPTRWRPVAKWPALSPDRSWQTLASEIAVRLPEIALLMSEQVRRAHEAGGLLRPEALYRQPGKVLHLAQWQRAPADDPVCRWLRNSLQRAFNAGTELADLTGVEPPVGIMDAVRTLRQQGEHATVREVIDGSFAAAPTPRRQPSSQPTAGTRWPECRDRHR